MFIVYSLKLKFSLINIFQLPDLNDRNGTPLLYNICYDHQRSTLHF